MMKEFEIINIYLNEPHSDILNHNETSDGHLVERSH